MDAPRDCQTERNGPKTSIRWYCLHVEILKRWYQWTYLQNGNRVTDVDNKLMVWKGGAGRGIRGGEKSGVWAWHMYTAMYKIDNKDRL